LNRRYGAGLFALALAVRLFFALCPPTPEADAADYLRLAQGLRSGAGYVGPLGRPTAFRPPLYPLFLAATGPDVRVAPVLQALLGATNCLLTVALAARMLGGPAAWIAGALLAVDPVQAAASSRLLSEVLYQTLFLLTLLVLGGERTPGRAFGAGLLGGASLLVRSAAMPVLATLAAVCLRRESPRYKSALLFVAGALLAVSPWLARNAAVMGAPVLSTQGGITLYSSYLPAQGKLFGVLVHDDEVVSAEARGEVAADRQLTRAAMRVALAHPLRTLRLAALKVAFFWVPIDWEIARSPGALSPVYLFALPLAIAAVVAGPRRFHPLPLLLAVLTAFGAIVYGSPRLRLPYDAAIYVLAAERIARLWRRPWLWLWAAVCAALALAGDLPRLAVRSVARALGFW